MQVLHDTASTAPTAGFRARIEATEQFVKVFFTQRTWNDIKRAGLVAGGERWLANYLHLRFEAYARTLGYRGKNHPPLVDTGRLRAEALANSWVEARVTSGSATLILHISVPVMLDQQGNTTGLSYAANRIVYDVLSAITTRELDVIAMTAQETILSLVEGADSTVTRKGTVKKSLSTTQRESISHTKRPSGPSTTTRKAA